MGDNDGPRLRIFISYRRQDVGLYLVGSLREALAARLGHANVLLDIDSIPLGVDVRLHIRALVELCDVMLVLVGPGWQPGRLAEPGDFVRLELLAAQELDRTLVPVLLAGHGMPRPAELPVDLRWFCDRNASQIAAPPREGPDIEKLVAKITALPPAKTRDVPTEQRVVQRCWEDVILPSIGGPGRVRLAAGQLIVDRPNRVILLLPNRPHLDAVLPLRLTVQGLLTECYAPAAELVFTCPPPPRDALILAWADAVLPKLKGMAKARFAAGRFIETTSSHAVLALPNAPHRDACLPLQTQVEEALEDHFGRPVPLRLVVDAIEVS